LSIRICKYFNLHEQTAGILVTLSEERSNARALGVEQLIAIDPIERAIGFLRSERMDDVMAVDDVAVPTAGLWRAATQATPRPTNDRL
jgi:hypothetical protein